jgi:hypothetical protein
MPVWKPICVTETQHPLMLFVHSIDIDLITTTATANRFPLVLFWTLP